MKSDAEVAYYPKRIRTPTASFRPALVSIPISPCSLTVDNKHFWDCFDRLDVSTSLTRTNQDAIECHLLRYVNDQRGAA